MKGSIIKLARFKSKISEALVTAELPCLLAILYLNRYSDAYFTNASQFTWASLERNLNFARPVLLGVGN